MSPFQKAHILWKLQSRSTWELNFVLLSALFLVPLARSDNGNKFNDFQLQYDKKADRSSMLYCFVFNGKIANVDPNNEEKGYKCEVNMQTWTKDDDHAKDYCESRFPYYIIGAKPTAEATTTCTFQINLKCADDYWQIHGKCYKLFDQKYTWEKAIEQCSANTQGKDPLMKPKVAHYYSITMNNYLQDMIGILDAWVYVSDLRDYFVNGKGNAAVYVQDGAYKFDTRKGDILMDDHLSKHQVICEYTPGMTMAEMFYLADIYSEIYPIHVYTGGAIIPSANFMTVLQTGLRPINDQSNYDGKAEKFTTDNIGDICTSIGNILNVNSYPMTAIEEEFNDVKSYLKDQRFFLTNAFKNDGCSLKDFKQKNGNDADYQLYQGKQRGKDNYCHSHSLSFNKDGRFPTMAGMRAPALCTLHYPTAIRKCEDFGAALSGFDSYDEYKKVLDKLKPNPAKNPGSVLSHYFLGGRAPCKVDCDNGANRYLASWDSNVAVNTTFLNSYNFRQLSAKEVARISVREDDNAFHLHDFHDFSIQFYVCGKSANFKRSDRIKSGLKVIGK
ncbi:hypothetical protein GCK72_002507 [Caenorhabditis remanei]|uniref:C-type lectin domain-containing protein n=1 Tax=Caenorhabditis remanei TaxID=31234 RepID=A0A6A5HV87_CAERE|nr:hypothetical protein GCK72_002507 [Caenorhabditis remanei]KAF1770686.1 hypothetical protein GCK72_002507 [Caenorhabditis remanei]